MSTCLEMKNIEKSFPGVKALSGVSFELECGELHSLVGENGAGKSTLMKVLGGAYIPDEGEILLNGRKADIENPSDAIALGISIIYQEFNLVPTLSIAENMFLGKELTQKGSPALNRKEMEAEASQIIERLGMKGYDCSRKVNELSVAHQQMVEIGKALFNKAKILVMDEPTAVLSQKESDALFSLIAELKNDGISIIYISHRLEEVLELSDRITVLRDGEVITSYDNSSGTVVEDDLIKSMVGRSLTDIFPDRPPLETADKIFEVKGLCKKGVFEDISFDVHAGEILGFSGLVGSGRTEVMKALFGAWDYDSGEVKLNGESIEITSTDDAIAKGIALVPEDRKGEGLVLKMSLGDNICLPNLKSISSFGKLLREKRSRLIGDYISKLSIRPGLPNRSIRDFSGGNQQKAVISKWLATNPKVIILDEPTRGVDVGAKVEIYKLIDELSKTGVAIVFISSEQLEVLGMCDRIHVLHNGRMAGEFSRAEATEEKLMKAAAGY